MGILGIVLQLGLCVSQYLFVYYTHFNWGEGAVLCYII